MCHDKSKNKNSLQHIVVLHSIQKLTLYLDCMGLLLFCSGQHMLEGQEFFLCLYLIYNRNNLLHGPHSCKNTSVCYEKTILNIDWHDILPFIYINEFFHDKEISHKVHGPTRTENTRHI